MEVPFLSLKQANMKYEDELKIAFESFLSYGYYILGNSVSTFELNFAAYCHTKHCVGVANGLDALVLILNSYEFPSESEVIVPANTYFASILAIKTAGLKPILVEPNLDDYLINVDILQEKISPKTVAVLTVNLYGRMCDFDKLQDLCKNNNLKLIVDAAQSHGAIYNESKDCLGADAVAFSFYPTKNLGALSDAGAVTTNDSQLAAKIKRNRNYGSEIKYQFDTLGTNSRLSELQAAFLNVKLKYLDQEIAKRREIAARYLAEIKNDKLILPPADKINDDSWHLFVIRTNDRSVLLEFLKEKKIGYDIHYPIPPHMQKALSEFNSLSLPITEEIHNTILSIPINHTLTYDENSYIIASLNSF